jgi:type II secretory pathway component PulF
MDNYYFEAECQHKITGKVETINLFTLTVKEARNQLITDGFIPINIRIKKMNIFNTEFIDAEYKTQFLRSLNFHVQAGTSPSTALKIIIESEEDKNKRVKMNDTLKIIEAGGSFSNALRRLNFFPPSVLSILESGEKSGNFKVAIESASQYMTDKRAGYKKVIAAFAWLSFDLFSAVSTVWYNQFFYIPDIEKQGIDTKDNALIERFHDALNLATDLNMLLLITSIIVSLGIFGWIFMFFSGGSRREQAENIAIKIPLLKRIIFDSSFADTFGIMARLMSGRVSPMTAAEILAKASSIKNIQRYWLEFAKKLTNGDSMAKAMTSPLLSRGEIIQLNAHQNLDQLVLILLAMSENRMANYGEGIRKMTITGTALVLGYSALSVLIALWVTWIQYGASQASMGLNATGF